MKHASPMTRLAMLYVLYARGFAGRSRRLAVKLCGALLGAVCGVALRGAGPGVAVAVGAVVGISFMLALAYVFREPLCAELHELAVGGTDERTNCAACGVATATPVFCSACGHVKMASVVIGWVALVAILLAMAIVW